MKKIVLLLLVLILMNLSAQAQENSTTSSENSGTIILTQDQWKELTQAIQIKYAELAEQAIKEATEPLLMQIMYLQTAIEGHQETLQENQDKILRLKRLTAITSISTSILGLVLGIIIE